MVVSGETAGAQEFPPEGTLSSDRAVAVGGLQNLFLRGGSNQLFRLYEDPDFVDDVALASAWADLAQDRQKRSDALGIGFQQIIIPEKTSVYASVSPLENTGETRLLKRVRGGIAKAIPPRSMLDCYGLFSQSLAPLATYRRLDSHLSTFGAHTIVAASLARLGHPGAVQGLRRVSTWRKMAADLGERFPEIEHESMLLISRLRNSADQDLAPQLVEEFDPGGGHIGMVKHWRCENAPIGKRVLIFGNSFFGAALHSGQLSWWFARLFAETRFVWSPGIDWETVRDFQPDYLITQTIERFLPRVPEK